MGLVEKDLSYLKEPRFIGFGQSIFRKSARLPIFAAILETAPEVSDLFMALQISKLVNLDRSTTYYELRELEKIDMVTQHESLNFCELTYMRLDTTKWEIARVAVQSAREQLGL